MKIYNLNNHPGILPYKIGTAKLISDHWTFVQEFNLKTIIDQYKPLKLKAHYLSNNLTHNSDEFNTALYALQMLENFFEQIIPTFKNLQRTKRGLFNPLGSFIKCITGNLDQNDAEEINAKITALNEARNKLKTDAINQITIMNSSIRKFQEIISNITHNEIILKSRILQIEQYIKDAQILNKEMKGYFQTFSVINQITMIYQSIYNILDTFEIATTLAKLNTLHNSIIDPKVLLAEIKKLEPQLETNQLAISTDIENILILEKIIEIKCYLKDFNLVFIFELPLVEPDVYQYFEIFPLPVPKNSSIWVNIPHKPYLALSNTKYSYMDAKCREMVPEKFICLQTNAVLQENEPPCEVQLLNHEPNITTCHPFELRINSNQITQITDGKWIIIIPTRLINRISCQNVKENIPLIGSYLVEVPIDCKIDIQSITLQPSEPNRLPFYELTLPNVDLPRISRDQSMTYQSPSLDLDAVNIREATELRIKLMEQKGELQKFSNNVYVNRVSFWTIVIYALIACLIVYLVYVKCSKFRKSKNVKPQESDEIF